MWLKTQRQRKTLAAVLNCEEWFVYCVAAIAVRQKQPAQNYILRYTLMDWKPCAFQNNIYWQQVHVVNKVYGFSRGI